MEIKLVKAVIISYSGKLTFFSPRFKVISFNLKSLQ